jgi:hypothetical protein
MSATFHWLRVWHRASLPIAATTEENKMMRRYEPRTPRLALGLASLAVSAIVLSVLVIFPAQTDAYDDPLTALAAVVSPSPSSDRASENLASARKQAASLHCASPNLEPS